MKPVVVNARFLSQPLTGVQRFALQICLELQKIYPDLSFIGPPNDLGAAARKGLKVTTVGRLRGHAWEQLELPRYLRSIGSPLLLNLCSTGPLLYGRQIVTHHDITYVRHPESFSLPFRVFYRSAVPILLKRSLGVVTVSDFSKKEIAEHFRLPTGKISVVPNAVDERFSPRSDPRSGRPFFLAVSSPSAHKNFNRLLDAYNELPNRDEIDLKIVGGRAGNLRGDGCRVREEGRVEFLGRCSDADLITLYQSATAFIFPSIYEGFGIPPLEAQACGCPVLASDIESVREVLGDSALYFDPFNSSSIAMGMAAVLGDKRVRTTLVERGFENVRRFSWRRSAEQIAELIGRVS